VVPDQDRVWPDVSVRESANSVLVPAIFVVSREGDHSKGDGPVWRSAEDRADSDKPVVVSDNSVVSPAWNVWNTDGDVVLPDGDKVLPDGDEVFPDKDRALPDRNVAFSTEDVALSDEDVGRSDSNVPTLTKMWCALMEPVVASAVLGY